MLTGAKFYRNHSETVLVFAAPKRKTVGLAKAFGVDKAAFHPL